MVERPQNPFGKYARWIIEFEGLNYKIKARNGLDHVVPDCLSRIENPVQDDVVHQDEVFLDNAIFQFSAETNQIESEQKNDPAISMAMKQLKDNNEIRQGRYKRFSGMAIKNNILMREDKIVIPNSLRYQVTEQMHNLIKWVIQTQKNNRIGF